MNAYALCYIAAMNDESTDLTMEILRKIQRDTEEMNLNMQDVKTRIAIIEEQLGRLQTSIRGTNRWIEHVEERLERIENRL